MRYDLAIRGASVHDGTGAVFPADVGILGDWIAAVGKAEGPALRTVEAAGRVLAPGFIDLHSHADIALLRDPRQECKVLQGVTTEVFTNCGLGCAPRPVPEYESLLGKPPAEWDSIEGYLALLKPSVNVAYLAAHGAVRYAVMGMEERPASRDELKRMRALVQGALGISTGPYYSPMRAADPEETAALAAETGGICAIHIRDHGRGLWKALDEAFEIAARSRAPLEISHLQAIRMNRGKAGEILSRIDEARSRGLDVTADVYPYDAGSTMLSAVRPEEYDDIPWAKAYLVGDGSLIGTAERARQLSGPYLVHDRTEEDVDTLMRWPHAMIGSDGLHVGARPHPRLWGTFPRVLAKWGLEMIPKLTSMPARRLGLKDRGVIRERAAADLVLLSNPRDRATYEEPTRPPEGIDLVVVNGVVVAEGGRHTGATPGRVLRRS